MEVGEFCDHALALGLCITFVGCLGLLVFGTTWWIGSLIVRGL